jgi:hypothetical protein
MAHGTARAELLVMLLLSLSLLALLAPLAAVAQRSEDYAFDPELFDAIYQGKVDEVVRHALARRCIATRRLTQELFAGGQDQERRSGRERSRPWWTVHGKRAGRLVVSVASRRVALLTERRSLCSRACKARSKWSARCWSSVPTPGWQRTWATRPFTAARSKAGPRCASC